MLCIVFKRVACLTFFFSSLLVMQTQQDMKTIIAGKTLQHLRLLNPTLH